MNSLDLILASASPRRAEMLRRFGLKPRICPPEVDETALPGESPAVLAARLASRKCGQVAATLEPGRDAIVLAADTVVVFQGAILGKPADRDEARRMLEMLSGNDHQVLTAVALFRNATGRRIEKTRTTEVRFRVLGRRWIDWYLDTGEPEDKAGSYGIQGYGAVLVDSIRGSWANVVGLPVEMLPAWLAELDVDFLALAGQPTRLP